jgi:hypothetical protein
MPERFRLINLVILSIVVAAILVAFTVYTLDFGDGPEGKSLVKDDWRALGTEAEPEFHEVSLPFEVGSGTGMLRVSYKVDLPSDLAVGLPGSLSNPSPEVRLKLLDGSGSVVWTDVLYGSAKSTQDVTVTASGHWTLHVWVEGYGYEGETGIGTPVEFHDSLEVIVSAV